MDTKLFDILACPVCKGKIHYDKPKQELICKFDRMAFPIKDDIPLMLESEARLLTLEDIEKIK